MPHVNKNYRAFISYSHKDAKWAKWLHKALEQYHVPIDAYPQDQKLKEDGTKRDRRLTPVFRDRDELPASGSLADTIQEALEASENLIVLCSPNSAASKYVNAEIETFRGLKPENEEKVYALVVEGEPPGCFPEALTAGGAEPIAADAREEGDGKADAKLKLIAGLLGVGFDRLKQREAKRQRNRLLVMVSVVSMVAVMTSVLAVWALKAEKEATKQKEVAVEQRALAVEAKEEAVNQKNLAVKAEKEAVEAKEEAEEAKEEAVKQKDLAEAAEIKAVEAKEEAVKQKDLAVQSEKEAKTVLLFFNDKVMAAARPKQQDGGLGINATIREAIDAAEPQISKAFADQPKVEATIRSAIGTSYWYLGEARNAIPQLKRALALRVRELGQKNPDTLRSMRVLATSYRRAGMHKEALELRERTLELEKEQLGPKHADTLTAASNLANSYREAGRFEEALVLYEETLRLRKEVLGPEEPATISSIGNLAGIYVSMGRNEEALPMRKEVLKLFTKVQGVNHPDTLSSMQNLANSYDVAGLEKEARVLHEKTLKLRIEVQGEEHPETLRAKYNMANTFINAGRLDEAVFLHKKTMESMIEVFGPKHRDTVGAMNSLAYSYWKSGRLAESERQYTVLIAIQKEQNGTDFRYFYTQSLLGEVLTDMNKYAAAEPMLLEGYKGMEKTVPNNNLGRSQLRFAIERLVDLYGEWKKPDKVRAWQQTYDASKAPEPATKASKK